MIALWLACATPPATPGLVIISADGLRADRLGTDLTPNLNTLAADGLVFTAAFSQSSTALLSHAALLTGREQRGALPETALTLPEVLGLYGYDSAAFVSMPESTGISQGFAQHSAQSRTLFAQVPAALRWAETARSPMLLMVQGEDPSDLQRQGLLHHLDTSQSIAFDEQLSDPESLGPLDASDRDHVVSHYDAAVLATDFYIGRLLRGLEAQGVLESALVVVTAGHGYALGEAGEFGRASLSESTTAVPLILAGGALPEALRGTSRPEVAQSIDILPTVLGLMGVAAPAEVTGRELLSSTPPDAIVQIAPQALSLRTDRHRLLLTGVPARSPWLGLALRAVPITSAHLVLRDRQQDPFEQRDVSADQPQITVALQAALVARQVSLEPPAVEHLDPALEAILRERGYWGASP